jgi:hypothetical protein
MQKKSLHLCGHESEELMTPFVIWRAAGTQTLSGARISEFGCSVSTFTRWNPTFF